MPAQAQTGNRFLERLEGGPAIVADGGMGALLSAAVPRLRSPEEANLRAPDAVVSLHVSFINAGSDLIETNTFGANRRKLSHHFLEDELETINSTGVEEMVRELAPVGAERVRLDQVRARVDEADVQGHDRVGGSEIRFLRAAEPWHRGREKRSHAAVGNDRRAALEAFEKPVSSLRLRGHLHLLPARSTHPSGRVPGRDWHLAARAGCRGFIGPVPSASLDAERDGARFRDGVYLGPRWGTSRFPQTPSTGPLRGQAAMRPP